MEEPLLGENWDWQSGIDSLRLSRTLDNIDKFCFFENFLLIWNVDIAYFYRGSLSSSLTSTFFFTDGGLNKSKWISLKLFSRFGDGYLPSMLNFWWFNFSISWSFFLYYVIFRCYRLASIRSFFSLRSHNLDYVLWKSSYDFLINASRSFLFCCSTMDSIS